MVACGSGPIPARTEPCGTTGIAGKASPPPNADVLGTNPEMEVALIEVPTPAVTDYPVVWRTVVEGADMSQHQEIE
jgi:hypothetical protein